LRSVSNVHPDDLWRASVDNNMLNSSIHKTHYNYADLLQELWLPIHLCTYFGDKTNKLIKKFPSYYAVKFHCRIYKGQLLPPTVSRLNPIHISFFSTTRYNHVSTGLILFSFQVSQVKSDFPKRYTYTWVGIAQLA
jgi:hypothetical protein